MFHTPTNADRAAWAQEALDAFPAADNDDETNIKDLITDLLHLARRQSADPAKFDAGAFAQSAALMHDMEVAEDEED